MGRRPKQTFLQRRHTEDQQAHEKMLIIANYQRHVNQNHSEISPHPCQNQKVYHQKTIKRLSSKSLQITNVGKEEDKREPLYSIGGNVNWYTHYGKEYEVPQKSLKTELTHAAMLSR